MRSATAISLEVFSSRKHILNIGDSQWLMLSKKVAAVRVEGGIYFPDIQHTRADIKDINEYYKWEPHTRVSATDFDYYVASSGMRGLRPLLAKPAEQDNTRPEESNVIPE